MVGSESSAESKQEQKKIKAVISISKHKHIEFSLVDGKLLCEPGEPPNKV